ncbi:MAG: YIP1 family protein [Candidatus Hodarchaeales archaeon]
MDQNKKSQVMRYCGNCGKELVTNATFCAFCGAPIPKIGDFVPPSGDTPYIITKPKETSPRRSFFTNFRGAIVAPKEEMPIIASSPNFSQPFFLNLLIGVLAAISVFIFYNKFEMIFSESFLASFPLSMGSNENAILDFENYYRLILPVTSIFSILITWLLMSVILWVLHVIFASDLDSNARNYKKMATIVGWAQIPLMIYQIIMVLLYFFSPGGEIEFHSIIEREIRSSVSFGFFMTPLVIFAIIWSLALIYFPIKSLGSIKSNPVIICVIYGILYYFLFPTVI